MKSIVTGRLRDWIKRNEGFRSHPYMDTTGHVTIGYGRNLDDNGISLDEAEIMLDNDLKKAEQQLQAFPWYVVQPDGVKEALINMCFNVGIGGLLTFEKMIRALVVRDYNKAASEALDSKWASQVGKRSTEVALMIRQGYE